MPRRAELIYNKHTQEIVGVFQPGVIYTTATGFFRKNQNQSQGGRPSAYTRLNQDGSAITDVPAWEAVAGDFFGIGIITPSGMSHGPHTAGQHSGFPVNEAGSSIHDGICGRGFAAFTTAT